jgi:predicted TIM-barrel fold metal-dependent hydrolase
MTVAAEPIDPRVEALGYRLFDADNHYYEPDDAFIRYQDPKRRDKGARWVTAPDGTERLLFGDRLSRFLGSTPKFDPIGRPGVLLEGKGYGELMPCPDEFKYRAPRMERMDQQGVEATMLFPTLAVSVEQLVADDIEATYMNLHAFNQWLDDDWAINYADRLYAVPMLSLLDVDEAIRELEWVLERGARVVNLRPGPVNGRSPADRMYDRFWARLQEADVAVTYHAADDPYRYDLARVWGWGNVNVPARHIPAEQRLIAGQGRPMRDMVASMILRGLFERFPRVRIASIELGCQWAIDLARDLESLKVKVADLPMAPIDYFRRNVWVNPYDTEDLAALRDAVGIERMVFGSDYPHTDALPRPADFLEAITDWSDEDRRRIMRDNAREFVSVG